MQIYQPTNAHFIHPFILLKLYINFEIKWPKNMQLTDFWLSVKTGIKDSKLGIKKYFLNYIVMITMLNRQLLRCIKAWRWGIKWNLVYYFFSSSFYKKSFIVFFAIHPVTPVTSGCFNHLRWYFGSNKVQVLYNQQVPRGKKQKKKLCCYKMCLQVFFCCCCLYQVPRKRWYSQICTTSLLI